LPDGVEARQFQESGCNVLGVDPDARMAEFARRTGVEVEMATFEARDPAGRMFDAVIAGTAWHWVDPGAGTAKAAQVLRPGGLIAPFNNVGQVPAELTEALARAYQKIAPDSPVNLRSHNHAMDVYQPLFAKIGDGRREGSANRSGGSSTGSAPSHGRSGLTSCQRNLSSTRSRRRSWQRC
jgi:SAM-dependent methyltransferase